MVLELHRSLLLTLVSILGSAQTQVITPYRAAPSLSEVSRIRNLSDRTRKLRNFQPTSELAARTVFEVGIGYCSAETIIDDGYKISDKNLAIRLGDIQSFTITHIDASVHIRLTLMPTIKEEDLLTERPTFSALEEKYGEHVNVDMPNKKDNGRACIIGKAKYYETDRTRIFFLDELPLQKAFYLSYDANNIWWATPSVVSDPRYPFRVGVDAFGEAIKVRDY